MTSGRFAFFCSLVLWGVLIVGAQSVPVHTAFAAATQVPSVDTQGTWSGTFQSQHPEVSPFTMTVVIGLDPEGNLVGATNSAADCFADTNLQVTVKGSKVVLAGSDPEGNSMTFRGSVGDSGTILNLHYILNGANGKCESDDGTGTLGKR
jgi:hypothetical protein